ncbi:MAG TPA: NAD(P)H-binding protein, partial [Gammaproteobacteria bacterium]|nr:NAD(P)H-binding protein [Gammaproteobacteria bacterium]
MHRTGLLLLLAALLTGSVAARASEQQGALVLVAGATGRTGTHVVAQLLESGYRVRALARDAERATQALPAGVELIEGDVREPQSLAGAVREARYVISAVGSNSRRDPANSPEAVDYRGIEALVDASLTAGVEQFVLVSAIGTGLVQ